MGNNCELCVPTHYMNAGTCTSAFLSRVLGGGFRLFTNSCLSAVYAAPSAPTITAVVAGNARATVSFTAPTSNGGTAVVGLP